MRKEPKGLLLVHHATIKDLQKQVTQATTIDNSKSKIKTSTTKKIINGGKNTKKKTTRKKNTKNR